MKAINSLKLQFEGRSVNEAFSRTTVAAFVAQLDPTVEELCDIRTAVSEAVTNSIVHGYRTFPGKIRLNARIYPGRKIEITVSDRGCGIENIPQAMEPRFTTAPEGERSGLGFSVLQAFFVEIRRAPAPGAGTSVRMIRTLSAPETDPAPQPERSSEEQL